VKLDELESEILRLPEEERERLARTILRTLEPDPEVERLWIEEAERRYQDYVEGREEAIPGEEAIRSIRALLG
jgi:putative addiction module component (TIGR02574 family)